MLHYLLHFLLLLRTTTNKVMAGEDGDGDDPGYLLPEDPYFFPSFDFDFDYNFDFDNNFGFPNIVHPDQHDAGNLVDGANPSGNRVDGRELGYLPTSPDFFEDLPSDRENVVTENEPRHPQQSDEQVAGNLVMNQNTNENYSASHNDVGDVPEEPGPSRFIHSDQGHSIDEFEFSHPEEHDADTIIEDANPSENIDHSSQEHINKEHHANVTGDFASSQHHAVGVFYQNLQDYPSLEHVPLESHFHGHELDAGYFAGNTNHPSQEHVSKEHHVEENVAGEFASSQLQGSENDSKRNETERWPGWPGQNVFRLLVPVSRVASLIGPKGAHVRQISEETKARIRVLKGPIGIPERVFVLTLGGKKLSLHLVLISAKEEPDRTIPPAIVGLLRIHKYVYSIKTDHSEMTSGVGRSVITRSLAYSHNLHSTYVIAYAITINLHLFALREDTVVEIRGEPAQVHKAVELVALFLRKFLVDRSVVQLFEVEMQRHIPAPPPPAVGVPVFAPNHQYSVPYHPHGNYQYPPAALPAMDNHLHEGPPPAYATDASMGTHSSSVQPQQSVATKVTQYMQIPMSYAEAVIGAMGANISYIRGTSGASITVCETKGMQGEMTFEITGTLSEIQAAQVLVQNFMAGAASATPNQEEEGSSSAADHGHRDYI
ncbi:hypothetical protein RIF29_40235 [Crotalaria pallida]|uniref:K Homology domain-containing protein n=1 Tax=Crotalaria pallida TaxID=3830 RepID=A0AAN9E369_CROPI